MTSLERDEGPTRTTRRAEGAPPARRFDFAPTFPWGLGWVTAWALGAGGWGCFPSIDLSKLEDAGSVDDAGSASSDGQVQSGGDGGASDGAPSSGVDGGATPPAPSCSKDEDCSPPNACYRGRCDRSSSRCVFDLCPQTATCTAASCDKSTATCGQAIPYRFRTVSFDLTGRDIACGGDPKRCIAAVFPFLFIGTTTGVVAFQVSDIVNNAPPLVPLRGFDLSVDSLVASGRRLFVTGPVEGAVPPAPLKMAILEVPTDPTVAELVATTIDYSYPVPRVEGLPAPNGSLFHVWPDEARRFPTLLHQAPFSKVAVELAPAEAGAPLLFFPVQDVPASARFVGVSGSRIVAFASPSRFGFVNNPGRENARVATTQTLRSMTGAEFASGPDGSVLSHGLSQVSGTNYLESRLSWIVSDEASSSFLDTITVATSTFALEAPTALFPGPIVWLDADKALFVESNLHPNTLRFVTGSKVRVASRTPTPNVLVDRIHPLSISGNSDARLGMASSNGLGYLLQTDSAGRSPSVSMFDPRCP